MRIQHLLLPSHDPQAATAFYRDVLQLPLRNGALQAGWSRIQLVQAKQAAGSLHLAFNVAHARLQSQSVYFAGPDASVLELIARRPLGLHTEHDGDFSGSQIQCLSEVGLPCSDVAAVTARIHAQFAATPLAAPEEGFAAVGDHHGLLILVADQRRWFPQNRQLPSAAGVQIRVQCAQACTPLHDAHGWELHASMP
jgi:catechol-2,3-dioxygenase